MNTHERNFYRKIVTNFLQFCARERIPLTYEEFSEREYTDELEAIEEELGVSVAFGLSKLVLIPYKASRFVIKIPFYREDEAAYCEMELSNYIEARNRGVDMFFAALHKDRVKKTTYYLQARVGDTYSVPYSKETKGYYYERPYGKVDDGVIGEEVSLEFIEYYGEDGFEELYNFLLDMDINDVHSFNYGKRFDGAPVIFDYSGF